MTLPLALAGTANLWQVESVRSALPTEPAVLFFGLLLVAMAVSVARRPESLKGSAPLGLLLLCFLPGVCLASLAHPYSVDKSLFLFTMAPVLMAGGLVLAPTSQRRQALAWEMGTLGLIFAISLEVAGTASSSSPDRVGLDDGNVIGLGRICSLGAVCLVMSRSRGRSRWLALVAAALCLHAASLTGSRGPLLGALASIAVLSIASRREGSGVPRKVVLPLIAGFALWIIGAGGRLAQAYGGESDAVRLGLIQASFRTFAERPLGVGWGDLVLVIPDTLRIDAQGWRQYPHNLVAETAVEGGIVALLGLSLVICLALTSLWRAAVVEGGASLAALVAALLAALTSSDLTGNRAVWMMIGVGLAAAGHRHAAPHSATKAEARDPETALSPREPERLAAGRLARTRTTKPDS